MEERRLGGWEGCLITTRGGHATAAGRDSGGLHEVREGPLGGQVAKIEVRFEVI